MQRQSSLLTGIGQQEPNEAGRRRTSSAASWTAASSAPAAAGSIPDEFSAPPGAALVPQTIDELPSQLAPSVNPSARGSRRSATRQPQQVPFTPKSASQAARDNAKSVRGIPGGHHGSNHVHSGQERPPLPSGDPSRSSADPASPRKRKSAGEDTATVLLSRELRGEILALVRAEACSSGLWRRLGAVALLAAVSALGAAKRLELQMELFQRLLRGGWRAVPFAKRVQALLLLEAMVACIDAGLGHLASSLAISWQERMIHTLHNMYFAGLTYYHARDLAPHERLAIDVPMLAQEMASATCNVLSGVIRFWLFGVRITRLAALEPIRFRWGLTLVCAVPAIHTGLCILLVQQWKPRVTARQRQQRNLESLFRRHHDRFRRHSDEIAMCRGEPVEVALLLAQLRGMRKHGLRTLVASWLADTGQDFSTRYGQHAVLASTTLLAHIVGWGHPELRLDGDSASSVGALRLLSDALAHQISTLAQLTRLFQSMHHLAVLIARVGNFVLKVRQRQRWQLTWEGNSRIEESPTSLRLEDVTVCTPNGRVLLEKLTFRVGIGEHLLICGPHGSGKTALARCMGSLWPVGHGSVALPGGRREQGLARPGIMYVPERALLGTGPLLRNQLSLPCEHQRPVHGPSDRELDRALELIGLAGCSDAPAFAELCLADHQRLGIVQLICCRPTFAILDGCISALPEGDQALLLGACCDAGITLVVISQRLPPATGQVWRRHVLELEGHGRWSTRSLASPATDSAASSTNGAHSRRLGETDVFQVTSPAALAATSSLPIVQAAPRPRAAVIRLLWRIRKAGGICGLSTSACTLVVAASIAMLRAQLARRAAAESAAILRLVAGLANRSAVLPGRDAIRVLMLQSMFCGLLLAMASTSLTHLGAGIELFWRCRLSSWLLARCVAKERRHCRLIRHFPDGIDKVIVDDAQVFANGLWRLAVDAVRRSCDAVVFGHAVHSLMASRGLGGQGCASRTTAQSLLLATAIEAAVSRLVTYLRESAPDSGLLAPHARLRRDAERIAFARAETRERMALDGAVNARVASQWRQRTRELVLSLARQTISRTTTQRAVWGFCVAWKMSANEADGSVVAKNFAQAVYVLRYLGLLVPGMSTALVGLGELFGRRQHLTEPACRMLHLLDLLDAEDEQEDDEEENEEAFSYSVSACDVADGAVAREVDVLPVHTSTWPGLRDLRLSILPGPETLVICGPEGAGKSNVARALCGLYPIAAGRLQTLRVADTMYLSVWPFISGDSLLDYLSYPTSWPLPLQRDAAMRLVQVLSAVGLDDICEKVPPDQAVERWADALTLSERQRLALARLLWHSPRFAVLDECTTALSESVEANIYATCRRVGISLIVCAEHRLEHLDHHRVLELDGAGNWRIDDTALREPMLGKAA